MTHKIESTEGWTTNQMLAEVVLRGKEEERVQFLVAPGAGDSVVQRLRVALSRSRQRNLAHGRRNAEFTLRSEVYPYTGLDGKRYDAAVFWCERKIFHKRRELIDDLMERE